MTGSVHNREAFLQTIANRLGREVNTTEDKRPKWKHNPQDDILKGASKDDLLEVLKKQCANIHTDFVLTSRAGLIGSLKKVVNDYGGGPIVTWNDTRLKEYGLLNLLQEEWPGNGIPVHLWDPVKPQENIQKADKANVGITISEITLAESGTAVLFSSQYKGRTVSFLPTNSIIIIPNSSIVPRMTQAARIIREKIEKGETVASCINFITGPSNSADIEMNLVVGVHGPVKATYLVVEDL